MRLNSSLCTTLTTLKLAHQAPEHLHTLPAAAHQAQRPAAQALQALSNTVMSKQTSRHNIPASWLHPATLSAGHYHPPHSL